MIMRTFLEQVDLGDARVHAFVTYAMSELGNVERDYRAIRPDMRLGEPLAIRGDDVARAKPAVQAWLDRAGLA